ncbi:MAG TPA: hypothetical protein VGR90_02095 [Acidimicrobiales bacterium]|nr:hypothetical protein [Acidimicrobiales bacterium]
MSIRYKAARRNEARSNREARSPVTCSACGRVLDADGVSRVDDLMAAHGQYSCKAAGAAPRSLDRRRGHSSFRPSRRLSARSPA